MSESERESHANGMELPVLAEFIRPSLIAVRKIVELYRPYIQNFMDRTAHQGKQKMLTNQKGEPATRNEVIHEKLGVGVSRINQLLASTDPEPHEADPSRSTEIQNTVIEALIAQGYKKKDAVAMVKDAEGQDVKSLFLSALATRVPSVTATTTTLDNLTTQDGRENPELDEVVGVTPDVSPVPQDDPEDAIVTTPSEIGECPPTAIPTAQISKTLLGTGSAAPDPRELTVGKAVIQAQSSEEAIAGGIYDSLKSLSFQEPEPQRDPCAVPESSGLEELRQRISAMADTNDVESAVKTYVEDLFAPLNEQGLILTIHASARRKGRERVDIGDWVEAFSHRGTSAALGLGRVVRKDKLHRPMIRWFRANRWEAARSQFANSDYRVHVLSAGEAREKYPDAFDCYSQVDGGQSQENDDGGP